MSKYKRLNGDVQSSCYKGQVWTFPVTGISKNDIRVVIDDVMKLLISQLGQTVMEIRL